MKPYSMALTTTSWWPSLPTALRMASSRPVSSCAFRQPLLVGLHVGKFQRIGRAQSAVHQLEAGLKQQLNPLPRAHLEMVLALRTYVQVGSQLFFPDRLAAPAALYPKAVRANAPFIPVVGSPRGRFEFTTLALEPGHSQKPFYTARTPSPLSPTIRCSQSLKPANVPCDTDVPQESCMPDRAAPPSPAAPAHGPGSATPG